MDPPPSQRLPPERNTLSPPESRSTQPIRDYTVPAINIKTMVDEATHSIFDAGEDILRCLIANKPRSNPARRHYEGSEDEWKVLRGKLERIWFGVGQKLVHDTAGALIRFDVEFSPHNNEG